MSARRLTTLGRFVFVNVTVSLIGRTHGSWRTCSMSRKENDVSALFVGAQTGKHLRNNVSSFVDVFRWPRVFLVQRWWSERPFAAGGSHLSCNALVLINCPWR